jgi:hypothetical protein
MKKVVLDLISTYGNQNRNNLNIYISISIYQIFSSIYIYNSFQNTFGKLFAKYIILTATLNIASMLQLLYFCNKHFNNYK